MSSSRNKFTLLSTSSPGLFPYKIFKGKALGTRLRFCTKTRSQMFLLVSVHHVGAHPGGHYMASPVQISINLGKTFLRISRVRNIFGTCILARVFVYLPPFIFQIVDFIYWTVLIFILIYFEWRDTENQQFKRECT